MREISPSLRTDKETADWVRKIIQLKAEHGQEEHIEAHEVKRRKMLRLEKKRKELLEMRLEGQIKQDMYDAKDCEYETEWRQIRLELECKHCQSREVTDTAIKAFELSQVLEAKWDTVDIAEKRAILEILCLNYTK